MLNLDFDRLCRLCLTEGEGFMPIFDDSREAGFSQRIQNCTCLKINKRDGLPSAICLECIEKLDYIKEFQNQCERSDTVLREYLQTKKSADKVEERMTLRQKQGQAARKEKVKCSRKKALPSRDSLNSLEQEIGVLSKAEAGEDQFEVSVSDNAIQDIHIHANTDTDDNQKVGGSCPMEHQSDHENEEQLKILTSKVPINYEEETDDSGSDFEGSKLSCLDSDEEFIENQSSKTLNKQQSSKPASSDSSQSRKRSAKKYKCEYCGRLFLRSNHLVQHELTHTKEKPFKCSYCQKEFWYKGSLNSHVKQTHTGDVNFTCDECGRGFFQKSEFMRHKPIHSSDRPFKCNECDLSFKLVKNLRRHKKVHTDTRTHTCQYCGKSFRMLQTLKVHLVLHSGEKPYKCSYCQRGFSQSAPLKNHIRTLHTKEKPYVCNLCGESFPTNSTLKSHVFKHTGIHPYSCKDCSIVFKRKRDLIDHSNKLHGGVETEPLQVPPQLPPLLPSLDQKYTQVVTKNLTTQQVHQNQQSSLLTQSSFNPTASTLDHQSPSGLEDVKSFTTEALNTISDDSLSSDHITLQGLRNQVSQTMTQALGMSPHFLSSSLIKSDPADFISPDILHFG